MNQHQDTHRGHWRRGGLAIAVIVTVMGAACQGVPATAGLSPTVQSILAGSEVRAAIVGVRQGSTTLVRQAQGDAGDGVAATPDMTFRIGGVSQSFLAVLTFRLAELGLIDLDAPIARYLADVPNATTVTPRMLIQSTAGYPDYVYDETFLETVNRFPRPVFSFADLVAAAVRQQQPFAPGSRAEYSHTNYSVLAMVLEAATGKKMPALYREHVFDRMKLPGTGYSVDERLPAPVLHAFSDELGSYQDSTFWSPSWTGESGPLYSTLDDLLQWLPAFGKGELLSAQSKQALFARPAAVDAQQRRYMATGYGRSGDWILHNPYFNGYMGAVAYHAGKDLTIVAFVTLKPQAPDDSRPSTRLVNALAVSVAPELDAPF